MTSAGTSFRIHLLERESWTLRWAGRLGRALGYAMAALAVWLLAVWPPPSWYRLHFPEETAFMAMRRRDGSAAMEGRRYQPVALERITSAMREAVIVAEDQRFYEHDGIDFQAVREAMGYRRDSFAWAEPADRAELQRALGQTWSRRDRVRGASTITQQLAKNLYLSPSRNPLRKLKEGVTAYRLEAALSKRRILELYLNVVELGPEVWGVEAASRAYFRRSASGLSAEQGALLAATLPSPLRANPGLRPGRIRWRQNLILRRMRGERVVIPPPEVEVPDLPIIPPLKLDTIVPPVDTERTEGRRDRRTDGQTDRWTRKPH